LVQSVNVYRNELTIIEPSVLNNAQWKESEDDYSKTFTLNDTAKISVRGEEITLDELSKLYKQSTVYVAVRDDYSVEQVMQVSVSVGGERFSVDRVEDIDKVIGNLELFDNNRNIIFNDGTIVIKNSKLVDISSIDKYDDVVVVSDYYKGQDNANVVRITSDAEKIFNQVYIGAIENIYTTSFTLRNYASISGNEWDSVKSTSSSYFHYFNDLNIIDITDKTNFETLPAYDFYHGGYSRKENENDSSNGLDYWRYYTFFVTDEDRKVIGMNIRQNGLLDGQMIDPINDDEDDIKRELDLKLAGLVLTRGTVAAFNDTYQRIEITDSHDWAEDFGRWNANRGNSAVEWRDAVIVKNSKRIEKEDINLGDYLYVLRDDEDALIIFVEEN
jgi:hypothetical protein